MNSEYCLANLKDENSANSQENVFNPFDFQHILNNDYSDPDIKFSNNNFVVGDSSYFSLEEITHKEEKYLENLFYVFHVNIRSLNTNFETLLEFPRIMKNELDVIAISETSCDD